MTLTDFAWIVCSAIFSAVAGLFIGSGLATIRGPAISRATGEDSPANSKTQDSRA